MPAFIVHIFKCIVAFYSFFNLLRHVCSPAAWVKIQSLARESYRDLCHGVGCFKEDRPQIETFSGSF